MEIVFCYNSFAEAHVTVEFCTWHDNTRIARNRMKNDLFEWKKSHVNHSGKVHDDVIIFRVTGHLCGEFTSPVNSPHKGQWRRTLMFSLISVWINGWVNNREAGDLTRHRGHYDVTVMLAVEWLQENAGTTMVIQWKCEGCKMCRVQDPVSLISKTLTPEVLWDFVAHFEWRHTESKDDKNRWY